MRKHQDWSLTACVFLFLSLASQILCVSQTHILNDINQQNLKEKDLINKLPGQPIVNFKQYGGYVSVDETFDRFLYYYFVEAINAKETTPLVIWFNGGPGCSSLQGAYLEHGPFRIQSDGKTLYRNPYSWNNEANVLYVESPAQVGFSYTNNQSDWTLKLKKQGDKVTAEDNYMFLVNWLERFPEYKGREFYITAQSYGGHYGPQLAQIILHRKNQTFINLRGVLIGNPGLDKEAESKGDQEFLLSHALISQESLDRIDKLCDYKSPNAYSKCLEAMKYYDSLTKHLDRYNIYAPLCLNSTSSNNEKKYNTVLEFDPCSLNYMTTYLNTPQVQEAMHTKQPYAWKKCEKSMLTYWSEEDINASILPILRELMNECVRVWVYSGDVDSAVSVTSTMYALKNMNLTVEKTWRPWFSQGLVGGYVEEYKDNFKFVTVRGGGHSVPSDQPIRALTLFTNFIRNTPLPLL